MIDEGKMKNARQPVLNVLECFDLRFASMLLMCW